MDYSKVYYNFCSTLFTVEINWAIARESDKLKTISEDNNGIGVALDIFRSEAYISRPNMIEALKIFLSALPDHLDTIVWQKFCALIECNIDLKELVDTFAAIPPSISSFAFCPLDYTRIGLTRGEVRAISDLCDKTLLDHLYEKNDGIHVERCNDTEKLKEAIRFVIKAAPDHISKIYLHKGQITLFYDELERLPNKQNVYMHREWDFYYDPKSAALKRWSSRHDDFDVNVDRFIKQIKFTEKSYKPPKDNPFLKDREFSDEVGSYLSAFDAYRLGDKSIVTKPRDEEPCQFMAKNCLCM